MLHLFSCDMQIYNTDYMLINYISVSYTHLDVYKRQGGVQLKCYIVIIRGSRRCPTSASVQIGGFNFCWHYFLHSWNTLFVFYVRHFFDIGSSKSDNIVAVSYTHLDVYKRQVMSISNTRGITGIKGTTSNEYYIY